MTRAQPNLYLLPTESHDVLLHQWPPVPDSMLFFHPSQTVKPLASWLPGASNESFIKATVSCVAHLFSQPSQALRALPNCLRMDDLSGGSRGNRNIPIHHRELVTHTYTHAKKHKWRRTPKEDTYIQACILCASRHRCACWVSQAPSALPGPGSVFIVLTNRSSVSNSSPRGHLGPLCQGPTTPCAVIRQTIQSDDE